MPGRADVHACVLCCAVPCCAQRICFDYSDIVIGAGNAAILERAISELASRFQMQWKIAYRDKCVLRCAGVSCAGVSCAGV